MADTNIEWADRVWNPVTGCTKVSQGCKNCYAEGVANRFWAKQYPEALVGSGRNINTITADAHESQRADGLTRPRRFTDVWTHADRLLEPLRWRKPARIFVNSMSDLFHEDVPFEFIDRVFAVMSLCPQHTFLVLTKRPERMRDYLTDEAAHARIETAADWQRETIPTPLGYELSATFQRAAAALGTLPWPYPNVHLGVSVENQQAADERIPQLLETPAAIRWISYEPALGPVTFNPWLLTEHGRRQIGAPRGLSWIVVGGESGPGARPFDIAWARQTVQQCKAADVPVFVKQLGAHPFDMEGTTECASTATDPLFCRRCRVRVTSWPVHVGRLELEDRKGGDPLEWPEDLRVRELPEVRP